MKKLLLKLLILVICISIVGTFSFIGCKKAEEEVAEEVEEAEEEVAEEVEEVEEEVAEEVEEAVEEKPVFGNIPVSMTDVWISYGVAAFEYAAEKKGVDVVIMDSEWDTEKALANFEDMVTKGVDSIGISVYFPEQAQDLIYRANEAGIPIAFENTDLKDKVEGDYLCSVACSYIKTGYEAVMFVSKTWPDSKLFYVKGMPGMGIVEDYQIGIDQAIEECGNVELVDIRETDWGRESAMNVTQDAIQAGVEFDVIFANNEDMAGGVNQALRDAGMFGEVKVIATGGGPEGLKMLEEGEIAGSITVPVSIQSLLMFKAMWQNYNGKEVDLGGVEVPVIPVTIDNVDDVISWEVSDWHIDYIGGLD